MQQSVFAILSGLGALLCLFFAWRACWRRHLMTNIPTAKVSGVFVGTVELKGTAESPQALTSHLTETRCVTHRCRVEEEWEKWVTRTVTENGKTVTKRERKSGWTLLYEKQERAPFYLQDETGAILVWPDQAELQEKSLLHRVCQPGDPLYYGKGPSAAIAHSTQRRRFIESAIPLHEKIYLLGHARPREDLAEAEIAHYPQVPVFLISVKSEEQLRSGLLWQFYGLGILGLILVLANPVYYHLSPWWIAGLASLYGLVWLTLWGIITSNALIDLRQRANRASSLIDIELKRRYDLIDRLVQLVQAMQTHEQTVQESLARLRAEMTASNPQQPGAPGVIAPTCRMLAENYPQLTADSLFRNLSDTLSTTEQRIALARDHYNDTLEQYHNRLETIPDGWLAKILGMRARAYFTAEGFTREMVQVRFE